MKNIYLFLILGVALGLTACGDTQDQKQKNGANESMSTTISAAKSPTRSAQESGFKIIETFDVGESVFVRSLAIDKLKNELWIGTTVGALKIDIATRDMRNTYTRDNGFANEYIFSILVDSQGGKWFGTNGGGVSYLKEDNWKTFFPMHGLADYWVYSFAEQANGTIWIGTWYGLNTYDVKTDKFNTYLSELVNEWVYGLAIDSKDQVWIGTEGGVNMFDGKNWLTWTHKDGLGAANKDGLSVSENTGLGTRSRHDLSVMLQGRPTYNPNYTFTLQVAADDTVWAGTWGGGASHFDGKKWTNYTEEEGLAGNIVYTLAIDKKDDSIWFGTNKGLSRFDGKNWYTFTTQDGLLDNSIYAIALSADGGVWVGGRAGVVLLGK